MVADHLQEVHNDVLLALDVAKCGDKIDMEQDLGVPPCSKIHWGLRRTTEEEMEGNATHANYHISKQGDGVRGSHIKKIGGLVNCNCEEQANLSEDKGYSFPIPAFQHPYNFEVETCG